MSQLAAAHTPVDTKHLKGRRTLHFNTVADAMAEAERLVDAERAGRLQLTGNWSLGQILGHLAGWVRYSFDGVPMSVPLPMRLLMKLFKKRILYKPMPAGMNLPRIPGGTLAKEPMSTEEGIAQFRAQFTRLQNECPTIAHLIFGRISHEEWAALHLRHAELHFSYANVQ